MFEVEIDGFVKKVPLKQLAQMAFSYSLKQVFFVKKGKKKALVAFLLNTSGRIFPNRDYVLKTLATEILFTEVRSCRKMIAYNHLKGTCHYTNYDEKLIKPDAYILPVMDFPSKILDEITNTIFKEEDKK